MKKICVLGLGYIGLPTASLFATHGHQVVGVDVRPRVLETLNHGSVHIEEPGLKTIVQAALRSGNLVVRPVPEPADVFIIAVPTPLVGRPDEGESPIGNCDDQETDLQQASLSFVCGAAESILPHLSRGCLVVLESTSPPGTTARLVAPLLERSGLRAGIDFRLAYCPERVLPGRILEELVRNNRIIGGIEPQSAEEACELYRAFVEGEIFTTDALTAEMVKLMENTFRDVNIALANEFARLAEQLGLDVWQAIDLANRHPRVRILKPGPGVGGHCIAVDPWFIAEAAPDLTPLIQTARRVNDAMPRHVVELVRGACPPSAAGARTVVACLGLSYKADVDDVRESPALAVIDLLESQGYAVQAYDPHVRPGTRSCQVGSLDSALDGAAVVVILTDHADFRRLRPEQFVGARGAVLVDTRNALGRDLWEASGWHVIRLGDGSARD
ncbi:MAG: nucleotide sugar dehydrogenase [Rudaea sp.]